MHVNSALLLFLQLFILTLFISYSNGTKCNTASDVKLVVKTENDLSKITDGCRAAVCCFNQITLPDEKVYFRTAPTRTKLYESFMAQWSKKSPAFCQPYLAGCRTLYLGLDSVNANIPGYRVAASDDKVQCLEDFHYTRFGESAPEDVKPLYSLMNKIYFRSMGMGRVDAIGHPGSKTKYTFDMLLNKGTSETRPHIIDIAKMIINCNINPRWYTCKELFYMTCGGGVAPNQEFHFLDATGTETITTTGSGLFKEAINCLQVDTLIKLFQTVQGAVETCKLAQCTKVIPLTGTVSEKIRIFGKANNNLLAPQKP